MGSEISREHQYTYDLNGLPIKIQMSVDSKLSNIIVIKHDESNNASEILTSFINNAIEVRTDSLKIVYNEANQLESISTHRRTDTLWIFKEKQRFIYRDGELDIVYHTNDPNVTDPYDYDYGIGYQISNKGDLIETIRLGSETDRYQYRYDSNNQINTTKYPLNFNHNDPQFSMITFEFFNSNQWGPVDSNKTHKKEFYYSNNATTSTFNIIDKSQFNIYPNPFSNLVHVNSNLSNEKFHYSIYNVNGLFITNGEIETGESIDLSSIPSGIYIVKLSVNKSNTSRLVFKK